MTLRPLSAKSLLLPLLTAFLLAPSVYSQTLTIVSGQGQIVGASQQSQPMVVKLLDQNGQPIVGSPIYFQAVDYAGGYIPSYIQYVNTGSDGTAATTYVGAFLTAGSPPAYDQGSVVASAGTLTQTFFVTTSNKNSGGGTLVSANFSQVGYGQAFSGPAGSVASSALQVQVQAQSNFGVSSANVPNVALTLVVDPSSTGTLSCQEGPFVLTNTSGVATCTPVFGKVGSGYFTIQIGGSISSQQLIPFSVTVGPPAIIQINSGNGQSGTPGTQLPIPIVATITDLGGNPTPGVQVNFVSVTPGGATFTNVRQTTDSQGKVSASVILGSVSGAVQISVTDAGGQIKNPAIFTETVNFTLTGLQKSSGDQQSAAYNTPFSAPLAVQLTAAAGESAQGTSVTFAITSGSATIANPTVTANSQGLASTTVTAGSSAGPVVVTATAGSYSVTFNLTVIPPGPANLTFTNGASGASNYVSPGSIVTIYGTGIASNLQGVASAYEVGPLPLQIGGVTVQFSGIYAPIFDVANVSGSQFITVQVPFEVKPGANPVTINTAGGGSTTVQVNVLAASPGLFTYAGANNQQYAVVIKSNGSVAGPANPATGGETVTMYVTGLPLTPAQSTNSFPAPNGTASTVYPLILGIANQGAAYTSVAASPDLAGVETITFTVPSGMASGPTTLSIGVQTPSGVVYSQGAILNVQ